MLCKLIIMCNEKKFYSIFAQILASLGNGDKMYQFLFNFTVFANIGKQFQYLQVFMNSYFQFWKKLSEIREKCQYEQAKKSKKWENFSQVDNFWIWEW